MIGGWLLARRHQYPVTNNQGPISFQVLQKHVRLRRPADLQRVRQQGRSWRHPIVILLAQGHDHQVSRFAFVASKRIGNAVVRNRAKRLLREAVRYRLTEVKAGWDCIFIARNLIADASYMEVETAVTQLLTRANLLRHQP